MLRINANLDFDASASVESLQRALDSQFKIAKEFNFAQRGDDKSIQNIEKNVSELLKIQKQALKHLEGIDVSTTKIEPSFLKEIKDQAISALTRKVVTSVADVAVKQIQKGASLAAKAIQDLLPEGKAKSITGGIAGALEGSKTAGLLEEDSTVRALRAVKEYRAEIKALTSEFKKLKAEKEFEEAAIAAEDVAIAATRIRREISLLEQELKKKGFRVNIGSELGGIQSLKGNVTKSIKSIEKQIQKDIVPNIDQGLREVIKDGEDTFETAAEAHIAAYKREWGIKSPARVGIEIGRQIAQGINKGFQQTINFAKQAQQNAQQAVQSATASVSSPFTKKVAGINSAITSTTKLFRNLAVAGIGFFAVSLLDLQGAISGIQDSLRAFAETEEVEQTLRNTASSAEEGSKSIADLTANVNRLKVDYIEASKGLAQLQAAAQGTPELEAIVPITSEALLQSARAYSLSAQQLQRANIAIAQSFSKSIVSQEELRGQLSEAIPNAIQVTARAYGITTQELNDLITQGELASTLFSKFSRQLKDETAITAAQSVNTLSASFVDLNNQISSLQVELIRNLAPAIKFTVDAISFSAKVITNNIDAISAAISTLAIGVTVALLPVLKSISPILIAVGAAAVAVSAGLPGIIIGIGAVSLALARLRSDFSATIVSIGKGIIIAEVLKTTTKLFLDFASAGESARKSIQAIQAVNAAESFQATADAAATAAKNTREYVDEIKPFFAARESLFVRGTLAKAEAEQSALLDEGNKQLFESINLLSQIQSGRQIDAKLIEKQISGLTRLGSALEIEAFLTEESNELSDEQISQIESLLPLLKEEESIAQGITTTYGKLNLEREKAISAIAKEEAESITRIAVLTESGVLDKEEAEQEKLKVTLNRIDLELQAEEKAQRDIQSLLSATTGTQNKKLLEQAKKTEARITELTQKSAETRINIQERETRERIKNLERIVKIRQQEIDLLEQEELIDLGKARQSGRITQEAFEKGREDVLSRSRAREFQRIEEEIQLITSSGQAREDIETRINDLRIEQGRLILDAISKAEDGAKQRLEDEKAIADVQKQQYSRQIESGRQVLQLSQARSEVERALSQSVVATADIQVRRLERGLEVVKRLSEGGLSRKERNALREEAARLGIKAGETQLDIAQKILAAEELAASARIESRKIELRIQKEQLAIETKIAQIEARAKELELKRDLAKASGDEKRILEELLRDQEAISATLAEQAKLKQSALDIQSEITQQAEKESIFMRKLDLARQISTANDRFRFKGGVANPAGLSSFSSSKTNSILSSSQKLLQSIADSLIKIEKQQGGGRQENIFNIATSDPRTPATITNGVINGLTEALRAF